MSIHDPNDPHATNRQQDDESAPMPRRPEEPARDHSPPRSGAFRFFMILLKVLGALFLLLLLLIGLVLGTCFLGR